MAITLIYAGALAIWFAILSLRVIQGRRAPGNPSLGDGGNPRMLRLMRGQANFAEYAPLILILMGLLELNGVPAWALHALGATLLVGRLLHGYALCFTDKSVFGRSVGTVLTFVALFAGAGMCLYRGLQGL